jgi:carbamoyltransferase
LSRVHRRESKYLPDRTLLSALSTTGIKPNEVDMICICGPENIYDPFNVQKRMEKYYGIKARKTVSCPHHIAHTALSVLASNYKSCFHWTIDAGGEDEGYGGFGIYKGSDIEYQYVLDKPSLPVFYLLLTAVCGFGDFEEGKVMGLSAYGSVKPQLYKRMRDNFHFDKVGHVIYQGDFEYKYPKVKMEKYSHDEHRPHKVIQYIHDEIAPDLKEMTAEYLPHDIAATGQTLVEDLVLESLSLIQKRNNINIDNIVLAGGFFNNILASQRIREEISNNVFVPPGVGDMGLSAGAALWASRKYDDNHIKPKAESDFNPYLGPVFKNNDVEEIIKRFSLDYIRCTEDELAEKVSEAIINNNVVGWFQGHAEFGARALGARSVLADPRNIDSKARVNQLLKRREWFMPYAPSILEEYADQFIDIQGGDNSSYYMTSAYTVSDKVKSIIPSAVHIDGTIRPQVVNKQLNRRYHKMISKFYDKTGVPLVLNTSFNRHGVPIVSTPRHAVEHLLEGVVDILAIEDFIVFGKENKNENDLHNELVPESILLELLSIRKWYTSLKNDDKKAAIKIQSEINREIRLDRNCNILYIDELEFDMNCHTWDDIALQLL